MQECRDKLVITSRHLDFGDCVVPLAQITVARVSRVRRMRRASPWVAAMAMVALVAAGVGVGRMPIVVLGQRLPDLTGVLVLTGLAGLVVALIFAFTFKTMLVIATVGGEQVGIDGGSREFKHEVLAAVRAALSGAAAPVSVDLAAGTFGAATAAGARPGAGEVEDLGTPDEASEAGETPAATPPVNGARSRHGTAAPHGAASAEPGASESARAGTRARVPSGQAEEVAALISLIEREQVHYASELRQLLEPVHGHLMQGRPSRAAAVDNWQRFHDYASKYLMGVAGLREHCERIQSGLGGP